MSEGTFLQFLADGLRQRGAFHHGQHDAQHRDGHSLVLFQLLAHGNGAVHAVPGIVVADAGDEHRITGQQGVGDHHIAAGRGVNDDEIIGIRHLGQAERQKHIDALFLRAGEVLQQVFRHGGVGVGGDDIDALKLGVRNVVSRVGDAVGAEHIIDAGAGKGSVGDSCPGEGKGAVALRVHVHDEDLFAVPRHEGGQIGGSGCLADAAFFNGDGNTISHVCFLRGKSSLLS